MNGNGCKQTYGMAVPFRLATVYFDDGRVRSLLRERADGLRAALACVTGRSEWGVKAYADEVRRHTFPAPEHAFAITPEELSAFTTAVEAGSAEDNILADW